MKVGSLCTGYGGLDLAVDALLGTETVWLAEFDQHASKVCARRFPGVPNLHDITAVDWGSIEPVDVLTAGYPCQPFSHAGRRKGTNDPRHLWPHIARAIRVLRPRLVVLENVAGHLSLGFDSVLGALAELGFNAEWCVVRASDVGACHQRKRLFAVATDTQALRRGQGRRSGTVEGREFNGRPSIELGRRSDALPADPECVGEPGRGEARDVVRAPGRCIGEGLQRQRDRNAADDRGAAAADTDEHGRPRGEEQDLGAVEPGLSAPRRHDLDGLDLAVDWGHYGPAVRRHEHLVGRPAPSPVDHKGRLSPVFVEWMMCLPEGWVTDLMLPDTDPRPDRLSRAQALKILGNGVVPPQAAYAIAHLLGLVRER